MASEMAPRYNVFWYDPECMWAATLDQAPGMIRYGEDPKEALGALLEAIDEITFDDEQDGHINQWCAVCWTTVEDCDKNAAKADELSKHTDFLSSIGVLDNYLDYEDVVEAESASHSMTKL